MFTISVLTFTSKFLKLWPWLMKTCQSLKIYLALKWLNLVTMVKLKDSKLLKRNLWCIIWIELVDLLKLVCTYTDMCPKCVVWLKKGWILMGVHFGQLLLSQTCLIPCDLWLITRWWAWVGLTLCLARIR